MKNDTPPSGDRQRIQIELPEKESEGIYSNIVFLNHTPAEFVLDFARILPGAQKAKIYSRIVMAPMHARSLLEALEKNVKMYEDRNGKIRVSGQPEDKEIGF
ncbi:MAG: DUF3467 domain-containing protein [bacterium]